MTGGKQLLSQAPPAHRKAMFKIWNSVFNIAFLFRLLGSVGFARFRKWMRKRRVQSLPRFRQLLLWKWSPHRVRSLLLFEPAPEYFLYVSHREGTHCWSWDTVERETHYWNIHIWLLSFLLLSSTLVNSMADSSHDSPVHLCGEHTHHRGNSVDVDDVGDGLKHIEVEEGLPWHGAIQPRLHKRRPVLFQHPLWPTYVILTDPGHARIHNLRGVGV